MHVYCFLLYVCLQWRGLERETKAGLGRAAPAYTATNCTTACAIPHAQLASCSLHTSPRLHDLLTRIGHDLSVLDCWKSETQKTFEREHRLRASLKGSNSFLNIRNRDFCEKLSSNSFSKLLSKYNPSSVPDFSLAKNRRWECFSTVRMKGGQTQCQRLPHEWGLGKGITEAKSYPAEILHRDGFEPRTWWLGELALTNCTRPALQQSLYCSHEI
jgi:hypothetical protein